MDSYQVGTNTPIKLKVGIETEAITMTYPFLYHSEDDDTPYSMISPFDPAQKPGWKQLDNGNKVNGKFFRVVSFLRFFNSFPDEETFNLAIQQVKDTYEASLKGGDVSPYMMAFELKSFYKDKTCVIESELLLT
ncbi:hypothetical protein [Psychroserpens sp. SPM9]|uniref:hypothetical protein n=1 Tax=Psychroserpens sp. SPM9 TaxID=2975598 RepID=UPI0021A26641|nr:hypothetical protein [Psychroserpens sp. SPM9]MDG5491808.1 hypothetical protein [Psychroserpens sp. SPM9]